MNKNQNTERAKEIFAKHSTRDEVHFSSDGQAFFLASDCTNNAKNLKDKTIQIVKRDDVMPSQPDADDEDFDVDDDDLSLEEKNEVIDAKAKAGKKSEKVAASAEVKTTDGVTAVVPVQQVADSSVAAVVTDESQAAAAQAAS